MTKFLWIERLIFVRNSWLLLDFLTQLGAKRALLRGSVYPRLRFNSYENIAKLQQFVNTESITGLVF